MGGDVAFSMQFDETATCGGDQAHVRVAAQSWWRRGQSGEAAACVLGAPSE